MAHLHIPFMERVKDRKNQISSFDFQTEKLPEFAHFSYSKDTGNSNIRQDLFVIR